MFYMLLSGDDDVCMLCYQVTHWSRDDAVASLQAARPVRRLSSVGGDRGNGCRDDVSDVHERFRY